MTARHATTVSFLALALLLVLPNGAQAKLTKCTGNVAPDTVEKENWIRLQLPIPNVTVTCTDDAGTPETADDVERGYVKDMGQYIGGLYKYFVGAIGIIASLMVFYGGLRWLSAGGNASRVKEAKEVIFAALIAILIAFGSYTLLYTINPKLVQLNPPVLKVADTFLVNFDNKCSLQKVCLSGTNAGKNCTDKEGCPPGKEEGSCGLPLELEGEANPVCGIRYTYKKIPGVRTPSDTCLGTFCAPDASGSALACRNSEDAGKAPVEGQAKCLYAAASCDRTTDTTECASLDQPGSGICRAYSYNVDGTSREGKCGWFPRLVCPTTGEEVGCGECNSRLPQDPKIDCSITSTTTPKYRGGAYQPDGAPKPAICCLYRYNNTYYYKY